MKLIYMQRTIDFIIAKHSHRISEIESIGNLTIKDIKKDDISNTSIKYYLFKID